MAQNQDLIRLHQIKDAVMAPTANQQDMVIEGDGHHKDVDEKYFSPTLLKEFENVVKNRKA